MSRKLPLAALAGFAAISVGGQWAAAAAVTVPNYSFEQYNSDYYNDPLDWTAFAYAPAGSNSLGAYTTGQNALGTAPNASQTTPVVNVTGTVVGEINFDNSAGTNPGPTATLYEMANSASLGTFAPNTTYTLNADYGTGVNPSSQTNIGYGLYSAPLTLGTLDPTDSTSIEADLLPATYTMYAGAPVVIDTAAESSLVGQPIYISLFVLDDYQYGRTALYDDVTLDATADAVPEPAALGLGIAALGCLLRRRRVAIT